MKILTKILPVISIVLTLISCNPDPGTAQSEYYYFGTFSRKGEPGIFVYNFKRDSMKFKLIQPLEHLAGPNFLAINKDETVLYSVNNETVNDSMRWGSVSAYRIDPVTGKLSVINDQPSYGSGPCHIAVDDAGTFVTVSNYGSGRLAIIKLNEDGSLASDHQVFQHEGKSIVASRQGKPYVHSSMIDSDKNLVYAADLGIDKVMIYDVNRADITLKPSSPAFLNTSPGAGPRHMDLNKEKSLLYVVEELSSTVSTFSLSGRTGMVQQLSALPLGYDSVSYCADIHIDPSGKFLFASNRGHNSIAVFSISEQDGMLTFTGTYPCGGNWPRNFMVDPEGKYIFVANERSDNVAVLEIDPASGALSNTGISVPVNRPVCIKRIKK